MLRLNGWELLFAEAKVSLAIVCPYWITRVSYRQPIYAGRASPVGEKCHILMCGDGQGQTAQGKTVNWRNISITLINLGTGVLSVNAW